MVTVIIRDAVKGPPFAHDVEGLESIALDLAAHTPHEPHMQQRRIGPSATSPEPTLTARQRQAWTGFVKLLASDALYEQTLAPAKRVALQTAIVDERVDELVTFLREIGRDPSRNSEWLEAAGDPAHPKLRQWAEISNLPLAHYSDDPDYPQARRHSEIARRYQWVLALADTLAKQQSAYLRGSQHAPTKLTFRDVAERLYDLGVSESTDDRSLRRFIHDEGLMLRYRGAGIPADKLVGPDTISADLQRICAILGAPDPGPCPPRDTYTAKTLWQTLRHERAISQRRVGDHLAQARRLRRVRWVWDWYKRTR